jgi:hypothetical protein
MGTSEKVRTAPASRGLAEAEVDPNEDTMGSDNPIKPKRTKRDLVARHTHRQTHKSKEMNRVTIRCVRVREE